MSILEPNDKNPHAYENIMCKKYLQYIQVKIISKQVAKISFKFDKAYNVSINLGGLKNLFDSTSRDIYQIIVSSNE